MPGPSAEDRTAINQMYARYSWALDTGDTDGYVALFTEDAVATEETRMGTLEERKGHEEHPRARSRKFHENPEFPGHQHQMGPVRVRTRTRRAAPTTGSCACYAWATIQPVD